MNIAATIPAPPNLASFEALDRETCLKRWRKQFDQEPPRYVSVEFMRRVFAFEAQVKCYGGHSKAVRHVLKSALKEASSAKPKEGQDGAIPRDIATRHLSSARVER